MAQLRFLTAGESHGPALVAILEGLPAGLDLDPAVVDADLARRQKGAGSGSRMKIESDRCQILAGVMGGRTIGSPLSILIPNKDHHNWQGRAVPPMTIPRPGHVDLAAALKYGYDDLRPGLERASARETAARVAVGAVCKQFLSAFEIQIGGYVRSIGMVEAQLDVIALEDRFTRAEANMVRCPDPEAVEPMQAAIQKAKTAGETLGGVIDVFALGLPPGLGSHVQWDRKLDAQLAMAVMSIPAVKGIQIGPAFENTHLPGTSVHDPIMLEGEDLVRPGCASGGLEGGMTTGQPLMIQAAMKPIPTTIKPQPSVDLSEGVEAPMVYERSDVCPVPRAVVVVEAMTAFVLAGALMEKLGGDSMHEMQARFADLRQPHLQDLDLKNEDRIWWP